MVDKISNYILDNLLYKNEEIEGDEREVMLFGITRIVEDIPKYVIIILISIISDVIKEVGLVFLITLIYKVFVGGAHARTNIGCLISSLIYFLIPAFLSKYLIIPDKILYVLYFLVFIFSLYVIFKISPADTEEIPILNRNKRKIMKAMGLLSLSIIYISVFIIKDTGLYNIALMTIFFVDLVATKPMYKFFKCKYSYESDEYKEYFNDI